MIILSLFLISHSATLQIYQQAPKSLTLCLLISKWLKNNFLMLKATSRWVKLNSSKEEANVTDY